MPQKRTVCRKTKSGRFAKKSKCRAFKKTKVTVRKIKAGQWLLNLS